MAYLGKTPSQAVRSRYYFTATGGETSLSGADDNANTLTFTDGNYVDVALNGVTLVAGTDYNTTTANTIAGLTALVASDVVEVIVYDTFSVFSGNVNGDFTVGGTLTAASYSGLPTTTLTSLGIPNHDDITVDASGNVGIGTSSPSETLHVEESTTGNALRVSKGGNYIVMGGSGSGTQYVKGYEGNVAFGNAFTGNTLFLTGDTERMRIDSSGQLIVGHDGSGSPYFNEGIVLNPSGDSVFHRDGNSVVDFSRETSDGNIVRFVKDNSVVGSIGASVGDLYIGTGAHGLKFVDASTDIRPFNTSTGASSDGTTDLGNSTSRFKDLYLSGGVYLGGTGSANKLDDYEEGSFTPTTTYTGTNYGKSYAYQSGQYVKIGKTVTCWVHLDVTADSGSTGQVRIDSLPFTASSNPLLGTSYAGGGSVTYYGGFDANVGGVTCWVSQGTNYALLYHTVAGGGTTSGNVDDGDAGSTWNIRAVIQYLTDA